jgi:transcriptional regulator with XRE-family HTH domain
MFTLIRMSSDQLLKIFAENVKNRRKELGLTQAYLAGHLNVTPQFVTQLERGQSSANLRTLAPLARVLMTTPDALLTEKVFSATA